MSKINELLNLLESNYREILLLRSLWLPIKSKDVKHYEKALDSNSVEALADFYKKYSKLDVLNNLLRKYNCTLKGLAKYTIDSLNEVD